MRSQIKILPGSISKWKRLRYFYMRNNMLVELPNTIGASRV